MRILIAGSTGLVGTSLTKLFCTKNVVVIPCNRKIVDLTNREDTFKFIAEMKPDAIIDAAAKVGGIGANNLYPVEFLSQNIQIQTNLLDAAHANKVAKLIFLGSSCIYPRDTPQPITESSLLTSRLENTNKAYAIAKIAGVELVNSYRAEYGYDWCSVMPTNLYGFNDNYDQNDGHVIPSLVSKFVAASLNGDSLVNLWGDGTPLREFLHADDLAEAIWMLITNSTRYELMNIGSGEEISINELASLIKTQSGFKGEIRWDKSQPNGTPRKLLDSSKIRALGWKPRIDLEHGLSEIIRDFAIISRIGEQ
jgi:GDP-L-fucose synthase